MATERLDGIMEIDVDTLHIATDIPKRPFVDISELLDPMNGHKVRVCAYDLPDGGRTVIITTLDGRGEGS